MKPNDKLKLVINYNNVEIHCIVVQNEKNYQVLLNDTSVATIQLNQSEKWVQLNGFRLPSGLVGELGLYIEASHRRELFAEN
ncbi:MAG: hypothetical protein ABI166_12705 [Mucilaginibacter sp.]